MGELTGNFALGGAVSGLITFSLMELAEGEYGSLLNVVTGTAIGALMGGLGGAIAENGQPLIGFCYGFFSRYRVAVTMTSFYAQKCLSGDCLVRLPEKGACG